MKFKIGDKVRINPNCSEDNDYYTETLDEEVCFTRGMAELVGCNAIIVDINDDAYQLDITEGDFDWSADMLLPTKITNWKKEFQK